MENIVDFFFRHFLLLANPRTQHITNLDSNKVSGAGGHHSKDTEGGFLFCFGVLFALYCCYLFVCFGDLCYLVSWQVCLNHNDVPPSSLLVDVYLT